MPKLSAVWVLFLVGSILTVVLLVLDKADKLKGWTLVALLIVAALLTLPLALGNSFVSNAPPQWKRWRRALMLFLVAFVYLALAIWISNGGEEEPHESAIIAIIGTKAIRDAAARRTVMELTFQNLGEIETVGRVKAVLLLNEKESSPNSRVAERLSFVPQQRITLSLDVTNKSQEGFDAIWSGRHRLEARVEVQFNATRSRKRTYIYRGVLYPKGPSINTLQSDYFEGSAPDKWVAENQFPKTAALPNDVQPYMKKWGFVGDGRSLFAEVETADLFEFSNNYVLVAAALLRDHTVDPLSDDRLQIGQPFEITGKRIRMEIRVSDAFKYRINSTKQVSVSFYLCLLPRKAAHAAMVSLSDVESVGGHIIGYRGVGGPVKMK